MVIFLFQLAYLGLLLYIPMILNHYLASRIPTENCIFMTLAWFKGAFKSGYIEYPISIVLVLGYIIR